MTGRAGRNVLRLACVGVIGCGGIVQTSDDASVAPTRCDEVLALSCPADPPIETNARQRCEKQRLGPCSDSYRAVLDCSVSFFRCGADGRIDSPFITNECKTQIEIFTLCYVSDGGGP